LALRSARDAEALDEQAAKSGEAGEKSFVSACSSVGGRLSHQQDGLKCDWSHKAEIVAEQPFQESTLLHAQMDHEEAAAKESSKVAEQYIKNVQDLEEKFYPDTVGRVIKECTRRRFCRWSQYRPSTASNSYRG
jgi:hypothetical protein